MTDVFQTHTAYAKSKGIYFMRAYVLTKFGKISYTASSCESLAECKKNVIRNILLQFTPLAPPHEIIHHGKMSMVAVENSMF